MITDYKETGKTEIYYLKKIWQHYQDLKSREPDPNRNKVEWKYISAIFNLLGTGIEPSIHYLFGESESFEDFETWVMEKGHLSPLLIAHFNSIVSNENFDSGNLSEKPVLSESDLQHWNEKGYVLIKNAVPKEDCEKTVELIYSLIDASPNAPDSWYQPHPLKQGVMIQFFQNELLDKNRLSPRIRRAYAQLWPRHDLIVSMDRVGFNPPETNTYQFPGPDLHWDVSLKQPIPYGLQGILYLSDTQKNQGAFTVIPGFQNFIDSWLKNLPGGSNPRDLSLLKDFEREPIAAEAGDFIIWNHCLPHGSSPNTHDKPRIVQYINYRPIDMEYHEEWI